MSYTPLDIAHLEEQRQAVGVAEIAKAWLPLAGGRLCFGGPGSWQNQAVGLGLSGPVRDDELDRLEAFYRGREIFDPEVIVCPFADTSLAKGLARRDYALAGFENVLFRVLDTLPESPFSAPDQGLHIRPVHMGHAEDEALFVALATSGFRKEGEPIPAPLYEGALGMLHHGRCEGFIAELAGEPVGGCAVEVAGEVATLMSTSVLPKARRQGVQLAMIAHRLKFVRDAGAKVATIQSRPGIPTERNARRMGFELAYTRAELRPRASLFDQGAEVTDTRG